MSPASTDEVYSRIFGHTAPNDGSSQGSDPSNWVNQVRALAMDPEIRFILKLVAILALRLLNRLYLWLWPQDDHDEHAHADGDQQVAPLPREIRYLASNPLTESRLRRRT